MIKFLSRLINNKTYLHLYPMSDKGADICRLINECDLSQDSELADDVKSLYSMVISEGSLLGIDEEEINRNIDTCYKTKRIKIKDEETQKKEIEKIKIQKKGILNDDTIKEYKQKLNQMTADATAVEQLAIAIEKATLDESQLLLCDKILRKNRIAKRVYVFGFAVIAILLILSLINMLTP